MDGEALRACTQCSHVMQDTDKFCPECGTAAPVVAVETEDDLAEEPTESRPQRPITRPILIAAVSTLGLALLGAAVWGLTRASQAETQFEVSAPVLMSTLEDLSAAQSSPVVRDVASLANAELSTIAATLDADPQADGADRLSTMQSAFVSLAALEGYRVEDTNAWTDNRTGLLDSLDTLSSYAGSTQQAAAEGDDTARTMDDLTRKIDKAMTKYRKQVRKARKEAKSERISVRNYHSNMEYLIDQYTNLRNDTGDFTDRMDYEDMYMVEVIDYFTGAATDRRNILNQMAQLDVPVQMNSSHDQIMTALSDGADAIDAAVAALEDAECFYGECYFEFNTQWQQFEDESDRITTRYGQAYDTWKATMARTEKRTGDADLPDKPDL